MIFRIYMPRAAESSKTSTFSDNYFAPVVMWSIVISMFVCLLFVCLPVCSHSHGINDINAICYVPPALWMTASFHITEGTDTNQRRRLCNRQVAAPGAKSAVNDCTLLSRIFTGWVPIIWPTNSVKALIPTRKNYQLDLIVYWLMEQMTRDGRHAPCTSQLSLSSLRGW